MTTLSKAEYLKKYLSEGNDTKQKKRRKKQSNPVPVKKIVKSRIVDDDLDISKTATKEDVDPYADEEAPTIAEVIDERPKHIQELEAYRNERWKKVNKNISRQDSDSDGSPMRRTRHDSESDNDMIVSCTNVNPKRYDSDSDPSPTRRRNDSDSDQSPVRTRGNGSDSDQSPKRKSSRRQDSDSDQSPPRLKSRENRKRKSTASDSDQSPPRKRQQSDSDLSPPRKGGKSSPKQTTTSHSDLKNVKTSRGAKAGLSSAAEMRKEMDKLRRKEKDAFGKMDKSTTGELAATVIRDQSGRKVDMHAEMKKDRKKKEKDEKYTKWSKGLKQQEQQQDQLNEALHEMDKPLARYQDDADLDENLREQDREGDPMLAFMKSKKTKKQKGSRLPKYSGPAPPPNRFGILPGYRWDGVNRSNGFEKKFYEQMNSKKARSEAAFKWSIEDM